MTSPTTGFRARRSLLIAASVAATLVSAPSAHAYSFGAKPSTATSSATPPAAGAAVSLPDTVDLTAHAVTSGNQGPVGSCVSWAIGHGLVGYLHKKAGLSQTSFAPMYVYSQTNVGRNKNPKIDEGSYPTEALSLVKNKGIATKANYVPQGDFDWQTLPTAAQDANAANYKISGYETLFSTYPSGGGTTGELALKNAIAGGNPVAITFRPRSGFQNLTASNNLDTDTTSNPIGWHEVLALGYNAQGLLVQNSWGTGWGNAGYGRLSWDVVRADVTEANIATGLGSVQQAVITTVGATSTVNTASITGSADLNGAGTGTVKFEWGTTTSYGSQSTANLTGPGNASFSKALSGLTGGTTYNYRVSVTTGAGTVTSGNRQFTTAAPPQILTNGGIAISDTQTNVITSVKTFGRTGTAKIDYGTTTGYGSSKTESIPATVNSYAFSFDLTGLTPGTTYNYKITYTTDQGTAVTTNKTFVTQAAPQILTNGGIAISDTQTNVITSVKTFGLSGTAKIDYGTTTGYGSSATESIPASTTANSYAFAFELSGLTPGTTYNYKITLTTSRGTTVTTNKTFVTQALPQILTNGGITISPTQENVITSVKTFGLSGTAKIDYGTTTGYGSSATESIPASTTANSYATAFELTGLTTGQTYQYKITLTTSRGTAVTTNKTFVAGD